MKKLTSTFCLLLTIASVGTVTLAQQQFMQTVTAQNKNCNATCSVIDIPELNGNPTAIVFVTPVGGSPNPHPIGAYFMYLKKWSIFNLDGKAIVEGAKFKVEYFSSQGPDRFVYVFQGGEPCIDHSGLTDNPNAQVRFFPTGSPNGALYNKDDLKIEYNGAVRKWCLANINGNPIQTGTAYNILITSGVSRAPVPSPSPSPSPAPTPTPTIFTPPATSASAVSQPSSNISATPALLPMARPLTSKSIQLAFDRLNDFAVKGLPASALTPTGDLDLAAVIMARQISRSDENSLPVLLTALQTAGFSIIDENGKVLRQPLGEGKGQGLAFYDFEAVGALKLANRGLGVSLDKIAEFITKGTPEIRSAQFSGLILQELRTQADNSQNAYLRFWARLIIELGKASGRPNDLMTALPGDANITILQASLLIRRLQGDFYALKTKQAQTGEVWLPLIPKNSLAFVAWKTTGLSQFRAISPPASTDFPCNLTNNESLILDAAANLTTTWSGWQIGKVTSEKVGAGLFGVNLALAWLKLVAAVTMLHGEITVDNPPLIRTVNSTPGQKRLMEARIWSEVGRKEMLNCVRPVLNAMTGLDFNLPTDGPLSGTAIEWHFAGDNDLRVNDAGTRNTDKFVVFETPAGQDRNPQNQITDDNGISRMYLVGASKVPEVGSRSNVEVPKTANVLVGVTLKSAKNPAQQFIDIGGGALGIATGGPLGILMLIPEIGYRIPLVPAHAEIPVTDHEPCNGQWVGTITYTVVDNQVSHKSIPASTDGYTTTDGGHENSDKTTTRSGTVNVNGNGAVADISYDRIYTFDKSSHGTTPCCTGAAPCSRSQMGRITWSSQRTETLFESGTGEGKTSVNITLDKDGYQISFKPFDVPTTGETSSQSAGKACIGNHPGSFPTNNASQPLSGTGGGFDYIVGKAKYGPDPNKLSGSYTQTLNYGAVTTITWNLRRCH